jgi:hypothetical protein
MLSFNGFAYSDHKAGIHFCGICAIGKIRPHCVTARRNVCQLAAYPGRNICAVRLLRFKAPNNRKVAKVAMRCPITRKAIQLKCRRQLPARRQSHRKKIRPAIHVQKFRRRSMIPSNPVSRRNFLQYSPTLRHHHHSSHPPCHVMNAA